MRPNDGCRELLACSKMDKESQDIGQWGMQPEGMRRIIFLSVVMPVYHHQVRRRGITISGRLQASTLGKGVLLISNRLPHMASPDQLQTTEMLALKPSEIV